MSDESFEDEGDLLLLTARKSRSSFKELAQLAGWASPAEFWSEGSRVSSPQNSVANLRTELTAYDCQQAVADGKECKMLEISWWLQLLKRQRLKFLPRW